MNRWTGIGRLTKDPELKSTASGVSVCRISVACNTRAKKKEGEWYDAVSFVPVVVWGKRGERCAEFLTKGALIYVEGRYETRKWEGKDGGTNYSTEIVATDINFLQKQDDPPNAKPAATTRADDDYEDIPF